MTRALFASALLTCGFVAQTEAQDLTLTETLRASRAGIPGARVISSQQLAPGQVDGLKTTIQTNPLAVFAPFAVTLTGSPTPGPLGLPSNNPAGCNPLTMDFDRHPSSYAPGDPFCLIVRGEPGTPAVVFWDTDPGPTLIPGLGLLQVGFGPYSFAEVIVVPPSGAFYECDIAPCFTGTATNVYLHGFSVDPLTLNACLTNPYVVEFLPCGQGCVYTQGYWKTHPCDWPSPFDPQVRRTRCGEGCTPDPEHQMFVGNIGYTQVQLLQAFERRPQGNALVILAHQLIAALLNVRNGATPPGGTMIADGMALIGNLNILTDSVPASSELGQRMIAVAERLDDYNNGRGAARHCGSSCGGHHRGSPCHHQGGGGCNHGGGGRNSHCNHGGGGGGYGGGCR